MTDEKAKRPRYTEPINFSVEDEPEPPRKGSVDLTPYRQAVAAYWQRAQQGQKASFGATVETAAVTTAISRFREAAREVGCGLNVSTLAYGDGRAAAYNLTETQTRLIMEARPARSRTVQAPNADGAPKAKATGLPKPARKAG